MDGKGMTLESDLLALAHWPAMACFKGLLVAGVLVAGGLWTSPWLHAAVPQAGQVPPPGLLLLGKSVAQAVQAAFEWTHCIDAWPWHSQNHGG